MTISGVTFGNFVISRFHANNRCNKEYLVWCGWLEGSFCGVKRTNLFLYCPIPPHTPNCHNLFHTIKLDLAEHDDGGKIGRLEGL